MYKLFPDKDVKCTRINISCRNGRHMPVLIVTPKIPKKNAPGIVWIHGGGLCAALCMMARDTGEVNIAYQMPLYPMLDNFDTETSADNHGKVWNTRKNHIAWKLYLRKDAGKKVSPYAAPARQTDYADLPPAYSFVGDGEPFYAETCTYINNLKKAGIKAQLDIYHSNMHAFDMMKPQLEISKQAALAFNRHFAYALNHYFAENS